MNDTAVLTSALYQPRETYVSSNQTKAKGLLVDTAPCQRGRCINCEQQ